MLMMSFSKEIPAPALNIVCTGISDPPTDVKKICYKCLLEEQSQVKDKNDEASAAKMRQRTGAGNDNYMKSLAVGDNYDENGHFICTKPKDFVHVGMLGKKPWDQLEDFEKIGKMRNAYGHVVDRPDITAEQKALQYASMFCIAQRNASLMAHEIGSLNSAYAGMTSQVIAKPVPDSPTSSATKSPTNSDFSFGDTNKDTSSVDTPLTDVFVGDIIDKKKSDAVEVAVGTLV
jgi:hypothetical protein